MNYEKQTFLNTEQLRDQYRHEQTVSASVPSARTVGGIRFHCEAAANVRLELYFPALSSSYKPYFDGKVVAFNDLPYFTMNVMAEKGDHIFDFVSTEAHGGALLRVSGVGVREGRRYFERIGGYYTSTQIFAYMKSGDRLLEKVAYANGEFTVTTVPSLLFDACLHYNKANEYYVGSLGYINTSQTAKLYINCGTGVVVNTQTIASAAIVDGHSLPIGHDYLIAYSDTSGVLHFYTAVRNGAVTESSTTLNGIKRVVSAQRGSVLLVQNLENVWRAFVFGSGSNSITVGNDTIPYTVYDLSRSGVVAPTADLEYSTLKKLFFYKDASGVLVTRELDGEPTALGYADAYIAGQGVGLFVHDNELQVKD